MDIVNQAVETIKRMYDLSLLKMLPVRNGGTGAADAQQALRNLGLPVRFGTWTPAPISSQGGLRYTLGEDGYRRAIYYSIGRLVYVSFYMAVEITQAGAGNARITGLPLSPLNECEYALSRAMFSNDGSFSNSEGLSAMIRDGTIRIQKANGTQFYQWKTGKSYMGFSGIYLTEQQ